MLTTTTSGVAAGGETMSGYDLNAVVSRLWNASRPLTAVGLLMLALTPVLIVAMWIDPRTITGAPAWLKPAKFAISTGIFSLTMAAIFVLLPERRRLRTIVGWVTAMVFVIEVAIIALQAWRGTTSHFNVSTMLDGVLFSTMGSLIVLQTLMTAAVAVALWRQPFTDRALGWALRLGLTLSIVGASTGGLMTRPTAAQLADARAGQRMTIAGAHTVGAPDGGPGLPGTGWSLEHGDLRIPHFIGLHAVQVLPIVALFLARRRVADAARIRLVLTAFVSYAALFGILLWQALRGQSVAAPDAISVVAMISWAVATVVLLGWQGRDSSTRARLEGMAI
jgi:hypothetical protein